MQTALRRARTDAAVLDPAHADQEAQPWRTGRFAERVRREWNPVRTAAIERAPDLGSLATAVQKAVGGDRERILDRLELFADAEDA